jgi:hypothetical protein
MDSNLRYHVHKSPPLGLILPDEAIQFTSSFPFKIHFNNIFPSRIDIPSGQIFQRKFCATMSRSAHSPWFYYCNKFGEDYKLWSSLLCSFPFFYLRFAKKCVQDRLPVWCFVTCCLFRVKYLLAPHVTTKLDDHPLLALSDSLFSIFSATLHIWRPPPSTNWGRSNHRNKGHT